MAKSTSTTAGVSTSTLLGSGGEVHQQADGASTLLTTNQGVPIGDNQNSLKAGHRGPVLLQDFILREKIMHFDHERIPERVVHARGSAAHGFFECLESCADVTAADFLQRPGERVPLFARFSTVAGSKGSADLPRDVRGFAVKFYTQQGNFDLVGNNIPVFFIQDAIKFPDLIHAAKQDPDRDAFAHLKVIAYLPTAAPLFVKGGLSDATPDTDAGLISLPAASIDDFIQMASAGRVWAREPLVRKSL